MATGTQQLLTILIPVYNEEPVLESLFLRLDPVVANLEKGGDLKVELLFTDNCSTDATFQVLKRFGAANPRIRIVRFSRNVGFQRSIITGYANARGDACVQIDADLEDPPELIIEFVKKWREGFKVVYGVRQRRHEARLMRTMRSVLYRLIDLLADIHIPPHAGDFRLIDRRIIDIVCAVNDSQPYLRGIIASLGFPQTGIAYDRDARVAGESSFNFRSYVSIAVDGILQTSIRPLYLSGMLSLTGFVASAILAVYYFLHWIIVGVEQPGFLSLILLNLFIFSFLSFCIAILSLYVGRIYQQVLKRPVSVIEKEWSSDQMKGQEAFDASAVYWPGVPPHKSHFDR